MTFSLFRVSLPRWAGTEVSVVEVEVYETKTLFKSADGRAVEAWGFRRQLRKLSNFTGDRGQGGTSDAGWFRSRAEAIQYGIKQASCAVAAAESEVTRWRKVLAKAKGLAENGRVE